MSECRNDVAGSDIPTPSYKHIFYLRLAPFDLDPGVSPAEYRYYGRHVPDIRAYDYGQPGIAQNLGNRAFKRKPEHFSGNIRPSENKSRRTVKPPRTLKLPKRPRYPGRIQVTALKKPEYTFFAVLRIETGGSVRTRTAYPAENIQTPA